MKKLAGAYRHELLRIFHSYRIYICIIAYVSIWNILPESARYPAEQFLRD